MALVPACFAGQLLLRSQQPQTITAVQTWAGVREARTVPVQPSRDVTVLVVADACLPDRAEIVASGVNELWTALHQTAPIRLGILRGGAVLFAGPFKTRAQLQSAIREMKSALVEQRAPTDPTALVNELLAVAPQLGSDWSPVALVGDLPALDRPVAEYAAAILFRTFSAQKLSVSWLGTPHADLDVWQPLFTGTGGMVLTDLSDLGAVLREPSWSYVEVSWDPAPLKSGFLVARAVLPDSAARPPLPDLVAAADATLPTLAAWAELRQLSATAAGTAAQTSLSQQDLERFHTTLERALSIDPHDPEALRAGASVYQRARDYRTAAALLANLAEATPGDAKVFDEMGQDLFRVAQYEPAERALLRARELGSATPAGAETLARIHMERTDDAGSLPFLAEVLKAQPDRAEIWFLQSEAAARANRPRLVASSLESGLALDGAKIQYRTTLIRLYLEEKRRDDALRHIHIVMAAPPPDAAVRTTYADFLDGLEANTEALTAWRCVLEIDRKSEAAWYRVGRLSLSAGNPQAALESADSGIDAHPDSARLYILKADAFQSEGGLYQARAALAAGKAKVKDLDLYRRSAQCEDAFRGSAAPAWRELSGLLATTGPPSDDLLHSLRRGLEVAVRDNDMEQAQWFVERLREAGQGGFAERYIRPAAGQAFVMMLPGGIDALAFIARAREHTSPERFLADYCRAVADNTAGPSQKASQQYLDEIENYFRKLEELESLGSRENDRAVVVVSVRNKHARQSAEKALALLGLRLRTSHDEFSVEEMTNGARKQDLAAALGVDAGAISKSLAQGKDFRIEIPYEPISIRPEETLWRQAFFEKEKMYGGLAETVTRLPRLARLYKALSVLDKAALDALLQASSLKDLYDKHVDLLVQYSAAFSIQAGRAVAPGSDQADSLWNQLAGASPREPSAFFRALLRKDDGRLLAFFFTLSQLDPPHQRFFTLTPARAGRFYRLFSDSAEGQRASREVRNTSFTDFLRDIPLDPAGHVGFPGSAEVWMVAKGAARSGGGIAKMLKKVSRAAAPDQEDEILVRLATTRYRQEAQGLTEVDNFLAVSRIDAHRSEPLDDEAALLLAQHYSAWSAVYPHLTTLTGVSAAGLRSFFAALDKVSGQREVSVNPVAGEFYALIELLCLLQRRGELTEPQAATLFGAISDKVAQTIGPAAVAAAGAGSIREILSLCRTGDPGQPDRRVRAALLGDPHPVQVGSGDGSVTLDPVARRYHDFDRVLEMQKVPALGTLLAIHDAAVAMQGGRIPDAGQIQALQKAVASIPSLTPGKELKFAGRDRDNVALYATEGLAKVAAQIAQKALRKKPNPKDFQRLAEDLLAEEQPQFTLALSGLVYAWYLRPGDLPVSEDAFLLRKHHFYDFAVGSSSPFNAGSAFNVTAEGAGSYFIGGFATFASASGLAAAVGLKMGKGVPDSVMAAQIAAIRDADWARLVEADQRLFNLRVQLGREWIAAAPAQPAAFLGLSAETAGLLSPARRSELLSALEERSWPRVWNAVTLSDVYALGLRCAAVCDAALLESPVAALLRAASSSNDGHRLDLFGPVPSHLYGCSHPHLLTAAPYEQYERHLFPTDIAERSAEFKMQLALAADQAGIPPAALGEVAEPLLRDALSRAEMSGLYDWRSLLDSWASVDAKRLQERLASR